MKTIMIFLALIHRSYFATILHSPSYGNQDKSKKGCFGPPIGTRIKVNLILFAIRLYVDVKTCQFYTT